MLTDAWLFVLDVMRLTQGLVMLRCTKWRQRRNDFRATAGKYLRLRTELAGAYLARAGDTSCINRLSEEFAATGNALVQAQPLD